MDVDADFGTNAAMVAVFASVLGDQFDPVVFLAVTITVLYRDDTQIFS